MRKALFIRLLFFMLFFLSTRFIQASDEETAKKKPYSSSTSFSFLLTSGNSQNRSLGVDTEHNWKSKKNHFQFKGSVVYSESEGSKDTEFYYSHFQNRTDFTSKAYILGFGKYERNVLSGYKYRIALTAGAGYYWLKSDTLELSSETAFGWSFENNIDIDTGSDISDSFPSQLISTTVKLLLSTNSELAHQDTILFDLNDSGDYRISSLTSLAANITRFLSFKLSYQLLYSHQPVSGFKSTDQYLLSSIVLKY